MEADEDYVEENPNAVYLHKWWSKTWNINHELNPQHETKQTWTINWLENMETE